ncbi:hypothetical protein KP509_01G106600 [Ceratopteris richardii]|uniref:carotenoid 9,10-dioxygenase n=1 Tax=Ceratopteris richardii TaxID=49495 RepID=A0A8T2VPE8_CERRI|nr:hypothetical protein KP509_01G106600 [Ceratopteris richardii]
MNLSPFLRQPCTNIPPNSVPLYICAFSRNSTGVVSAAGTHCDAKPKQVNNDISIPSSSHKNGVASQIIDAVEKLNIWAFYPHLKKPLQFLQGNFAPVQEHEPISDLIIEGSLPNCLNGEFLRIGPNPMFNPVAGFDGDGMIHALRIKDGKATYAARFVQTSRLKQEENFGAAKFWKLGDMKGVFGLLMGQIFNLRSSFNVIDTSQGSGTGNTAMTYHNGKLLALHEGDKPYAIRVLEDGDLQTLGFLDYETKLRQPFTAHPKVDPVTGELFAFGYQFQPPYCVYRVISKEGIMQEAVPITISGPIMMHDFAITEHYAIFMDMPLCLLPEEMVKGNLIFRFDEKKPARIGILPRYAKNESAIKWFELPTCFAFHTVNAWEEDDEVILYICRLPEFDLDMAAGPVRDSHNPFHRSTLFEMRFNMKTGNASQKPLSLSGVDFPRINEKFTGRKHQYAYCTILAKSTAKLEGLVKFNLSEKPAFEGKNRIEVGGNVEGVIDFGSGRYGSEAVFVPRSASKDETEDDGYLICFVHDEDTGKSEVCVYDAKTMARDPVAIVKLPCRVPYGFHALFVTEEELQSQR